MKVTFVVKISLGINNVFKDGDVLKDGNLRHVYEVEEAVAVKVVFEEGDNVSQEKRDSNGHVDDENEVLVNHTYGKVAALATTDINSEDTETFVFMEENLNVFIEMDDDVEAKNRKVSNETIQG